MSPVIRISDRTYERLQALAKPFVDTPESVIVQLLDSASSSGRRTAKNGTGAIRSDAIRLDPDSPENLTHTRVRFAMFGDRVITQPNWNKLVRFAHIIALQELGSFAALRRASTANIREGRYEQEGFVYHADSSNISVQGADANHSWQHALRLAREIGVSVEVQLEWNSKDEAAYPGKSGYLHWAPVEG